MNKQPISYLQTDVRWRDRDYSARGESTTIGAAGCGPSCAAMLVETITGKTYTPADACKWSMEHGYKALNQGTYFSYFVPQFEAFGITCKQLNFTNVYGNPSASVHSEALSLLHDGYYLIVCMGPGLWTKGGHFVVAWWEDGKIRINDPNSIAEERLNGDLDTFKAQAKYYWAVDARSINENTGGEAMASCAVKTFPQSSYTFRLYHNTGKKTWQQIKKETGCYGIVNTAYFNMSNFKVDSNTMLAGKWIYGPDYTEYGICINKDGRLTVGTNAKAVYDYTVGLPPCYVNGSKYFAYKETGKNGSSFVGIANNGDVTCLLASKDSGMTTAECCSALLNKGCTNIFRFDGSWSSQGSLGPGLDVDPSQERKVALYMLIFKKGTEPSQDKPSPAPSVDIKSDVKTVQSGLNKLYGAGLVVDGIWGPASKKALIKGVQTEINRLYGGNLVVDGIWGANTKAACPCIRNRTDNQMAWLVQAGLIVKGYDVDLDGIFGAGSSAATKRFQSANGLGTDGVCGPNTFAKLLA